MSEHFLGIYHTDPKHQRDAPSNRAVQGVNTSVPASSSITVDPLPWLADNSQNFYNALGVPLTFPAGINPFSITLTGEITAAGNGILSTGFSESSEGVLSETLIGPALVAGNNVINTTTALSFPPTPNPTWMIFRPSTNITAVTTPLTIKLLYNY
jgi:hypothetical protein